MRRPAAFESLNTKRVVLTIHRKESNPGETFKLYASCGDAESACPSDNKRRMTLGKAFIGWYDKRLNPHAEVYCQQPGEQSTDI